VTNYEAQVQRDNKQQMKIRESGQKKKKRSKKSKIFISIYLRVKLKETEYSNGYNYVTDVFNALYSSLPQ